MLNNDLAAAYTAVRDLEPNNPEQVCRRAETLAAIVQADAIDRLATTVGMLDQTVSVLGGPDVAAMIAREVADELAAHPLPQS
jgi:hypothetical protein